MRRMVHGGTVVLALVVLGACGGSAGGGGGNNPVVTIAKTGAPNGDAQTGTVAAELAESLRVVVKEDNVVKAGVSVAWSSAAAGATFSPTSSITDANGVATTEWSLGSAAGAQTALAALSGATGSPVTFTATGTAGPAANLSVVSGGGQTAILNGNFANQLRALVTDQFTNPVSGVTVTFVASGGIVLDSPTANTGVNGQAVVSINGAAAAGAGGVSATVVGIVTPVNFTLTTANAVREVTVGPGILFRSLRNSTTQPAVDTIPAGQGVLWRWAGGGHSVASTGTPTFTSSAVSSTPGNMYIVAFPAVGTYTYECGVHLGAMIGRIEVQ